MPLSPNKNYRLKNNSGFTLIEVLVAVALFSLAFAAISYVLSLNDRNAAAIKNNFIASGLAQEGVEVVRNIRDRDWFLGNSFATSTPDGTYRVQWNSQSLIPLGGNTVLKRDAASGMFSYDAGGDTIFARTIDISTIMPDVEERVIVNVTWLERGGALKSVSAEDHLFNWK